MEDLFAVILVLLLIADVPDGRHHNITMIMRGIVVVTLIAALCLLHADIV